jgi:hypothetical protein
LIAAYAGWRNERANTVKIAVGQCLLLSSIDPDTLHSAELSNITSKARMKIGPAKGPSIDAIKSVNVNLPKKRLAALLFRKVSVQDSFLRKFLQVVNFEHV